jgi:hypothetical protein
MSGPTTSGTQATVIDTQRLSLLPQAADRQLHHAADRVQAGFGEVSKEDGLAFFRVEPGSLLA